MASELKIVPLGTTSTSKMPSTSRYAHIPNFNSTRGVRWLCIGNSGSGKSLLIKNIICREEFGVAPWFQDNRFIISDTTSIAVEACTPRQRIPRIFMALSSVTNNLMYHQVLLDSSVLKHLFC